MVFPLKFVYESPVLEDVLNARFGSVPRPHAVIKQGLLLARFVDLAPSGVLSPKETKALHELFAVEPNLALGIKSVEKFVLLLSRGLRLMAWYRQYCKGTARKDMLKHCQSNALIRRLSWIRLLRTWSLLTLHWVRVRLA